MAKTAQDQTAAPAEASAERAAPAADTGTVRVQWQPPIKGIYQRFEDGKNTWESDGFTPGVAEVDATWWSENRARLQKDAGGKFTDVTEG